MTDFGSLRRDISLFFTSLKHTIDRPFRGKAPMIDADRDRFMRVMMMIEEARIRFNTYTRYREEPSAQEWAAARDELLSFVNKFMHSSDVDPDIYERNFRLTPVLMNDKDKPTPFRSSFIDEKKGTVVEALVAFRSFIKDLRLEFPLAEDGVRTVDILNRIVPRQQVAPAQFDIIGNRISIAHRPPRTEESDRVNIQSALEHIRGSGEKLIRNLEESNCDRRLLESIKELQSQIDSESNIVKIGLTNMACSIMGEQFKSEMPDAIMGMFNSYNASVSIYIAQFPEWDQFTQRAAIIDLDEDDVAEVDMAAGDVITALTNNPKMADPEVPKTIAFMREFLSFPGSSSRRAAFAMIRTIENLVSSIVHHSIGFFSKTTEKTVEEGSTLASKVIIGLLGIALMGASGIGPAAVRAGAPWVKQAAEIVQHQIETMTK
jgi:hypothetical protein